MQTSPAAGGELIKGSTCMLYFAAMVLSGRPHDTRFMFGQQDGASPVGRGVHDLPKLRLARVDRDPRSNLGIQG